MSRIEHHIGKLTEPFEGQDATAVMINLLGSENKPSYYKDIAEWFNDTFRDTYYYYNEIIYSIEDREYEDDSDIIEAKKTEDGGIEYQLRFYNGGASFEECLEEALNKVK